MADELSEIYALFRDAYDATPIDHAGCTAALEQSAKLVADSPSARTHALRALLLFEAARIPARVDKRGQLVPLRAQDRRRWDRNMLDLALEHLDAASIGYEMSPYHLEAAIAACHAIASTHAETNWSRIVFLYDKLLKAQPSLAVVELRAQAQQALDELTTK